MHDLVHNYWLSVSAEKNPYCAFPTDKCFSTFIRKAITIMHNTIQNYFVTLNTGVRGQLQIRDCGGNSCESVAGNRSRAEVSPHTLVPTVKNVICIHKAYKAVMNINIRASWAETEHACLAGRIWMQTLHLKSEDVGAQHPNDRAAQSQHCMAYRHWRIHNVTMWPNWLEQQANITHHAIVQQSKNHCNKRHTHTDRYPSIWARQQRL